MAEADNTPQTAGERAQDASDEATEYAHAFVVPTRQAAHVDHEANEHAFRQEAFQHGVRPTGDISHRSAKDKPSKGSTTITYKAAAVPVDQTEDPAVIHQTVAGVVPVPGEEDDETEGEGQEGDGEDLNPKDDGSTPAS